MGGIELKTDGSQRWMMYSKDVYEGEHNRPTAEQKKTVEEGNKFTQRVYAEVWARDTALVQRVRSFLGTNFHWHQRLSRSGSALEVIETLQSMIRGGSVVLVAEQFRSGGSVSVAAPPRPEVPSFRESLMTEYGMSYDAATAHIERYNDMVDRVNSVADRYANGAALSMAESVDDLAETVTPLDDPEPFEYIPDLVKGDPFDLAKTPNEGAPGSWYTNPGSGQMRLYCSDGLPSLDLDFDHFHNGMKPHAHNWTGVSRDGGADVVPFSPWPP